MLNRCLHIKCKWQKTNKQKKTSCCGSVLHKVYTVYRHIVTIMLLWTMSTFLLTMNAHKFQWVIMSTDFFIHGYYRTLIF